MLIRVPTAHKTTYLTVHWICDSVFDADSGNGIGMS